ncbi:hypothetical protein SAMN04487857_108202 [Pseudomonas sp. ok272]|nr:hypothetical protein SAMN04487857_108202 [Pseudomonas sp. ok272]
MQRVCGNSDDLMIDMPAKAAGSKHDLRHSMRHGVTNQVHDTFGPGVIGGGDAKFRLFVISHHEAVRKGQVVVIDPPSRAIRTIFSLPLYRYRIYRFLAQSLRQYPTAVTEDCHETDIRLHGKLRDDAAYGIGNIIRVR